MTNKQFRSVEILWDELESKRSVNKLDHIFNVPKPIVRKRDGELANEGRYNFIDSRFTNLKVLERNIFRLEMKLMFKLIGEAQNEYTYGSGTKPIIRIRKGEKTCYQDSSPKHPFSLNISTE